MANGKKEEDYNQNQNENPNAVRRRNPNPQQVQPKQTEKQKKQMQEAPSREDWEGGGSRPEEESRQRVIPPREQGRRGKRRTPQPKAGGTGEATEDR